MAGGDVNAPAVPAVHLSSWETAMNDRQSTTHRIDYEEVEREINREIRRQAEKMSPKLRELWLQPTVTEWPGGERPARYRKDRRQIGF